MNLQRNLAIGLLALPLVALAQPAEDRVHGESHAHDVLEEVRVTATPLRSDALEMTQSASVLSGEALNRSLGNSLGDTLKNMPGVASASFGANIGRPVIRGMDASRVGVLENNVASNDVSQISQDHAVAIEPFLADQVEVLRGPATLLYGSDTIGGVVNVRTNRVPVDPPEAWGGRAMVQVDSAARQRYAAGRLDGATRDARWGFHLDAFHRRSSDYEIPGFVETDPEPGEEQPGTLVNSALDNEGGALGASWFGERWRAGLAWSRYTSDYGIPGAGHQHHEALDAGQDEEEEEELVTIDLRSERLDGEVHASDPFSGFTDLKWLLNHSDYEHTEFEGRAVGTVFRNDTLETRLELTHRPLGPWRGVVGVQYRDRDFSAVGEEAFVPPSQTRTIGVFVLEEAEYDRTRLEFGMRLEDIDTRAADGRAASHAPLSLSAGVLWHVDPNTHLSLNLSRAQRAPGDGELFASGPHLATQTFEIGDADLDEETATALEASVRRHAGRLTGSLTVYRNAFDDFIYLDDTGTVQDELPVRRWRQQDATFTGAEVELRYDLGAFGHGHWQLSLFADTVRAELDDGSNVPRVPPARIGLALDWDRGPWVANARWTHASAQDDTAEFERPTAGYDLLDADVSYRLGGGLRAAWEVYLQARNLLDEDIRHHTSFLKEQAPQMGRNFILGLRVYSP